MNLFEQELAEYFGFEKLKKIQAIKVGIAGLGGLGSNCAANLVRSGFKKFVLCDFDNVEYSNLNRQLFFLDQVGLPKTEALKVNLLRINPDLELKLLKEKIEASNAIKIFSDCCVIVEAFDKPEYKKMLAEVFFSLDKLFVSVSGVAGWGNSDSLVTKKIKDNFYLIGDSVSEASSVRPPCAPRVAIVAAKQADVVLEWVLDK